MSVSAAQQRGATPLVLAAFLTTVILLGSNFVAVRFSNRELPPFWGAAVRFLIASVLLLAWARLRRTPFPRGRVLHGCIAFGVLVFFGMYSLMYWALLFVPSGVASVIFSTIPLVTFLMAVGLRMEPFRWSGLLGGGIVVAGIGAVSWASLSADVPKNPLAAVFLAALCAAASGIVVKRMGGGHPVSYNAVAMGIGGLGLLALSAWVGEPRVIPEQRETFVALAWLVTSAIAAFTLMIWVIGRWTASANAYGSVLQPLVTIPVAAWLIGEGVTPPFLVGAAIVFVGVYVGVLHRPKPRPPLAQAQTP